MTAEQLSMVAGTVLSLLFSYVPGLKTWYDSLSGQWKSCIMAVALIVVAAAIFAVSCGGVFDWVECTQDGAKGLVSILILALMANQSTYLITKEMS